MTRTETNNARTLRWLRKAGWTAEVVERYVNPPHAPDRGYRRDLFEAFDLVAVRAGRLGVLGVQCTSWREVPRRVKKLRENPAARLWRMGGSEVWVVGWRRSGGSWECRVQALELEDLQGGGERA